MCDEHPPSPRPGVYTGHNMVYSVTVAVETMVSVRRRSDSGGRGRRSRTATARPIAAVAARRPDSSSRPRRRRSRRSLRVAAARLTFSSRCRDLDDRVQSRRRFHAVFRARGSVIAGKTRSRYWSDDAIFYFSKRFSNVEPLAVREISRFESYGNTVHDSFSRRTPNRCAKFTNTRSRSGRDTRCGQTRSRVLSSFPNTFYNVICLSYACVWFLNCQKRVDKNHTL